MPKYIGKSRMKKMLADIPELEQHLADVEPEAYSEFTEGRVNREVLETLSAEAEDYFLAQNLPALYEEYFG